MTGPEVLAPRSRPCTSCPYRQDVPSGIWTAEEYAKLPAYDLDTTGQAEAGAVGVFQCHQQPQHLCAGWVGCHDMRENLGLRLAASLLRAEIDPVVFEYTSPVPLFASGAEAAEHGLRDVADPSPAARRKVAQLMRLIAARAAREEADGGG